MKNKLAKWKPYIFLAVLLACPLSSFPNGNGLSKIQFVPFRPKNRIAVQ